MYRNVKYPVKTKWVYEHIYGNDISWNTVYRELLELLHELRKKGKKDWKSIKEEFIQVYVNVLLFLHKHTGINTPMYGGDSCIQEFVERLLVWEFILSKYNKKFNIDYFRDGTNWKRPEKVVSILSKASVFISRDEAISLIRELESQGW